MHHGLNLEAVQATRYIHPPLSTRDSCGISTIAVNKGGLLLSRLLHTTELPLPAIWQLSWRPDRPYYQLRLSNIDSHQFRSDTPMRLDALCSKYVRGGTPVPCLVGCVVLMSHLVERLICWLQFGEVLASLRIVAEAGLAQGLC